MKKRFINLLLPLMILGFSGCSTTNNDSSSSSYYQVSELDPYITFHGKQNFKFRSDATYELPLYECFDGNDRVLDSSNLTIDHYLDGKLIDHNYISGNISGGIYEVGKHNFHFTLVDPLSNRTYEDDINLEIYQRIFYDGGDTIDGELFDEESSPYYITNNPGWAIRPFYLEKSYQYYAEATFAGFEGGFRGVGMIHSTKEDVNTGSFIRDEINANTVDDWWQYAQGYIWQNNYNSDYSWFTQGPNPLFNKDEVNFGENNTNVIACARNYGDFYFFLNGKLINKYTYDEYKNVKTIPGILFMNYGQAENSSRAEYDAKDFVFCDGEKAVEKLNSVLENESNQSTFSYLRYDDEEIVNYAEFYQDDGEYGMGFEYNNGIDLTGGDWYNNTISPRIHFIGDYQFEFDFEVLSVNNNYGYADWRMSINDARDSDNVSKTGLANQHSGMHLFYGLSNSVSTNENESYLTNYEYEKGKVGSFSPTELKQKLGLGRGRDKFHIKVKCTIDYLNDAEKYTYIFSNDNGEYQVDFITSNQTVLDVIRPVYIYFSTRGMNYRISNFSYEALSSLNS